MRRSIVFVLYFLFPFIVGLAMLLLLTLHHAEARDFCPAPNLTSPNYTSNSSWYTDSHAKRLLTVTPNGSSTT